MSDRYPLSRSPLVAMLGFTALLTAPVGAQYGRMDRPGLQLPFENGRIRVTQISVPAGGALPAAGNRVLIYLTADADGRMPADAVWQNADAGSVQNRGPATLEAIAIEFKDAATAQTAGTPPEALDAQYGVDVSTVIDNPRVLVTRQRYAPDRLRRAAAPASRGRRRGLSRRRLHVARAPICGARPAWSEAASM